MSVPEMAQLESDNKSKINIKKIEKAIYNGVLYTAASMFITMVLLCILQVLCRYIFKISLSFSEELARFLFIWTTFLGSVLALYKNKHVKMELLVLKFPKKVQICIRYLVFIITMVTYGVLMKAGVFVVGKTMQQTSAAMSLPMGLIYAAVPVTIAITAIFEVLKLVEFIQANKREVN